jgi:hypothetical protein
VTDTHTDQFGSSDSPDMKDTAKEQAQSVAATTKDEASNVVATAKEQAQAVTSDLRQQTRQLTDEARNQLTDHAFAQRDNAVGSLRSIGDELTGMAEKADSPGMGAQLTREVGNLAHKSADFLQEREPSQLVDELRDLARRRPGAFLLGAAAAGMLVGRLTRSAKSAHSSDSPSGSDATSGSYAGTTTPTGAAAELPYVVPAAQPLVEEDSWGPESPVYPAAIPVDDQPGVNR